MVEYDFCELQHHSINAVNIEAVERRWKAGNLNRYPSGRAENIISYTLEGKKRITGDNAEFSFSAPAIILISEGTPYTSETVCDDEADEGRTICIRFILQTDSGERIKIKEPFILWDGDSGGERLSVLRELLIAFMSTSASTLAVKINLFRLLSLLSERYSKPISKKQQRLLPAVKYIEEHLSENTEISRLAQMCFLSESYFRSCFVEIYGCSPIQYRIKQRIKVADKLLQSSLWSTNLIASELGFFDSAHFCHVYKTVTGKSPYKTE